METYRPSSSASQSTNPSSYGYYENNDNVYLPPFYSSPYPQEMPLVKDITIDESVGMVGKVSRYSPEEKKERIERYRSKRNQRNFQKKITYECRKTLADSRPRVKGRFARNDEAESEMENVEGSYGTHNNHIYDSGSTSDTQNLKWQTEAEAESYYDDEELWANLVDDFSINF